MAKPAWIVGGVGLAVVITILLSLVALQDGYVRYFLEIGAHRFLC